MTYHGHVPEACWWRVPAYRHVPTHHIICCQLVIRNFIITQELEGDAELYKSMSTKSTGAEKQLVKRFF